MAAPVEAFDDRPAQSERGVRDDHRLAVFDRLYWPDLAVRNLV
jgi:hypothetical protein